MMQFFMHATARPSRHWRTATLSAIVLCAGLAVPGRGGLGGGETVGTLPDTGGRTSLDISRGFRDASPSFYLEGPLERINTMVLGWTGRAVITEQVLDAATHDVRLTFHGDLRLELDRHAFEQGFVSVGWEPPQIRGSVRATMLLGDRTLATGLVSGRNVVLPVLAMERSGGLDLAPLAVLAAGRNGLHASLEISAHGDEITFSQAH